MKSKAIVVTLGIVVGAWNLGLAAEHPEHPTGQKEHPKPAEMKQESKEHPKKEHPNKAESDKKFQDDYEKVVKDYVQAEAQKTGGAYTIHDDVMNKDWKVELVKVHKSKICMLNMGKVCFACADFKEVGGKNKLDLDFYADHSEDGKITVSKVLIHKLNGKRRFTYDKDNNMVPLPAK